MLLNTYLDTDLIFKNIENPETSIKKVPHISYDFTHLSCSQNSIAKVAPLRKPS